MMSTPTTLILGLFGMNFSISSRNISVNVVTIGATIQESGEITNSGTLLFIFLWV